MFLNSIFSVAVASVGLFADEPKQSAPVKPIEVVELQRKDPVSYDKDVEPIFVKKCNFCHSGNIKEGKLDMSTFEALMKGGKKGASIVPGKSKESLLYQLAGKTQRPSMPPKSEEPLTPQELAIVKLWIDQGAKAPSAARVKPKIIVSQSRGIRVARSGKSRERTTSDSDISRSEISGGFTESEG